MQEPLVPMLFPVLSAHISDAEFQYLDLIWKEICGIMANLVAESGGNKGQLSHRLLQELPNSCAGGTDGCIVGACLRTQQLSFLITYHHTNGAGSYVYSYAFHNSK